MRLCESCGFDSVPDDSDACPLCGCDPHVAPPTAETPTVSFEGELDATSWTPRTNVSIGQVFADRYRIDRFLGRGGMGRVYKVLDPVDDRVLALKILRPSITDTAAAVERFKREIEILARIRHPAVPVVFGWGQHRGEYYFTSEFVDGRDLRRLSPSTGGWPFEWAVEIVATVAEALHAAHVAGVVHRDVKPHNIMVAHDESVHLVDFGVARGVAHDLRTITASGMIVGTPEYMAPEQVETHRVDHRSDIYSLGVVFFELLTGKLPFSGETPMSIAWQHKTEPPPRPRSLRNDLPAWLERVVLRCLEKNPARRHDTALELADELRRPRSSSRPRRRRLPCGDMVIEDEVEFSDWPLVLVAASRKTGWTEGMALGFADRHFRLDQIVSPGHAGGRWTYRFSRWSSEEVFRRIVDYEEDCAERQRGRQTPVADRVRRWLKLRD